MTKVIYTSGSFDILNTGHINILNQARKMGDYLIVGVSTNKLIKSYKLINPIMNLSQRMKIISSLRCVDKVVKQQIFFDIEQLRKYNISTIVLGDDWKNKPFPELEECIAKLNMNIHYIPYTQSISSSKIKTRIIKQAVEIIRAQGTR